VVRTAQKRQRQLRAEKDTPVARETSVPPKKTPFDRVKRRPKPKTRRPIARSQLRAEKDTHRSPQTIVRACEDSLAREKKRP
jgi:hypothetical protein